MLNKNLSRVIGFTLLFGGLLMLASEVQASHRGSLEERRLAREEARVERDAEREARRKAREDAKQDEKNNCDCRASVKFARPDLQWRGGTLVFTPRVDVDIRTRGESTAPNWSVDLLYGGISSFASADVNAPVDIPFGEVRHIVGGQCGDNRYSFDGMSLEPVTLTGLISSLVGIDQELNGNIEMKAQIQGCGFDEEHESFDFEVEEFGNLDVNNWRRVRS